MRRRVLHHDNIPAHLAKLITELHGSTGIKLMTHPPYTPDLASCDFFRLLLKRNYIESIWKQ